MPWDDLVLSIICSYTTTVDALHLIEAFPEHRYESLLDRDVFWKTLRVLNMSEVDTIIEMGYKHSLYKVKHLYLEKYTSDLLECNIFFDIRTVTIEEKLHIGTAAYLFGTFQYVQVVYSRGRTYKREIEFED
jgi:hypothetical protein